MADIFVSYARADQEIVRRIVALLEAQGWSVWWDTRIAGGERWDATIEREINAARCVVVVWTPQSINREWVHLEAHHGRKRGILVPILIGLDEPPLAFSLMQARKLSHWDGVTDTAAIFQLLADVWQRLNGVSGPSPQSFETVRRGAPTDHDCELAHADDDEVVADIVKRVSRQMGLEIYDSVASMETPPHSAGFVARALLLMIASMTLAGGTYVLYEAIMKP
jgi:adenylate cyclase